MTFLAPFRAPFQNPFPKEGGAAAATYAEILRDTYGASEIWPLVDISSGTTISAFVDSARNGTLTGWDLQNAAGPVSGTLAPYVDGVNDYSDIGTASFMSNFSGAIGSLFGWFKLETWADGITRTLFRCNVTAASANSVYMFKSGNDKLRFVYSADVNTHIYDETTTDSGWFSVGISWKDATQGDEVKFFFNGSQVSTTKTGNGTWAGIPTIVTIGSYSAISATLPWLGWPAYYTHKFGSIWSPTDFQNMHNAAATAGAD